MERRRVLSADFTLGATGLVLDGFDAGGGETLSISQFDTEYRFTLSNGSWSTPPGESPEGITLDGQTLAIKTALVDQLVEGLTVVGNRSTPLHVSLDQADFSSWQGSLNFMGIRSIDQVEDTEVALGTSGSMQIMAPQTGMTIGSLNVAGNLNILSFGPITDGDGTQINVTGDATFISRAFHPAGDFDDSGEVTSADYDIWAANFGLAAGATKAQGDANGDGAVDLADYSLWRDTLGQTYQPGGIFLADNLADQLTVGGRATFEAQEGATRFDIDVGAMGTTNFGSLVVIGASVDVQEDSSTELMGVDAEAFSLTSAGAITDADGTTIDVTGLASFDAGANPITLGDDAGDTTNFGQLKLVGGAVSVTEDSGTELTGVTAASLDLTSDGPITDAAGTTISVTGEAKFNAGASDITLGDNAADSTNFGQLNLTGGVVTVTEDSSTELTGVSATMLHLTSAGAITEAGTTIDVSGDATFISGGAITLSDNAADILSVGGLATFRAGAIAPFFNITIGPAGMVNFGQLHLTGAAVVVQEDSATVLTHVTATTLNLSSTGSITDADGTTINVTNLATFHAGANPITLGNHATDATNFGQVNLTGGVVMVQEDSATELTGIVATELVLESAGAITDSATADIEVTGPVSFTADGNITLADAGPANSLVVHGLGSFVVTDGHDIDIGVLPATGFPTLANAQLGSLQFTALGGQVRVALDGPIILSGSGSEAAETDLETTPGSGGEVALNDLTTGRLGVNSDAAIVDAASSEVVVNGAAALTAKTFITLANDGSDNRFDVGQHASFTSTGGAAIDLGVIPVADPTSTTRGTATDAILELGSFSFMSEEGNFTANTDNGVVFSEMSLASSAWISSAGAITDAFGADTTITEFAILKAADGHDIILGDDSTPGDTRFRMETPATPLAVFDATRFLAMNAENVSIQINSGVNLSTNPDFNEFPGTVFLAAEGNISQVGHDGAIEPLEANRIAMLSAAAVLFSQVRVKSQVTADNSTLPNLAIRGGTPVPISVLPAGEFPEELIPSSTIRSTSPIGFDPGGVEMPRPDGSGLNDLVGAQIMEPSAIGDDYSIIMKVLGDAKIGIVPDATGVQASLVGVEVTDAAGNAFLQTVADAGEAGDVVFTSMDAPTSTIVRIREGVFTAVAAGELTIDTDSPGEADAPGLRTTRLTSDTGTVTSVEAYTTFDGGPPAGSVTKVGPRMIVDAPQENQDAASTGLVFAPDFEHRITLVAGSRGENNLILEMEWADVQTPRDGGPPLGPGVDGTIPFPQVAYVPESVDGQPPQPFIQSSVPPLDFRAVTVRHEYAGEFIPDNPALPQLPTTIRLYNDPSINLYDQGGARNLNVAENFVSPRAVTTPPPGYSEPTQPEPPAVFVTVDRPVSTLAVTAPQSRVVVDEIRVSATSGVETIWYGRVDENGEFITGPGEEWPVPAEENIEGDRLNEIRDKINNSTAPEGVYRIISRTPRSDQLLDEWVKGDAVEESAQDADSGEAAPEGQEQPPQEEATNDGGAGGAVAPPTEQVGGRFVVPTAAPATGEHNHGGNALLASQLLVGAATLALGRSVRSPEAIATAAGSDLRVDLSRAGRRRRTWSRLLRPRILPQSRSEIARP